MDWKDSDIYGDLLEVIQYDLDHDDHKIVHGYVKNLVKAKKRKAAEQLKCKQCREGYRRVRVEGDGFWHEVMGMEIRCSDQTRPVSEHLVQLRGAR